MLTGTMQSNTMKVIGLTGNIACGKTTVSNMLKALGAIVIEADEIGRDLVKKGMHSWQEIKRCFGDDFLLPDGELDRKKLGEAIFESRDLKEKLDAIMFPAIRSEIEKQVSIYKETNCKSILVIDGALLLEAGWDDLTDEIWLVKIDKDVQLMRLMARDNLTIDKAKKRIGSQMSQDLKLLVADRIIDNSLSLRETEIQVKKLWSELQ